MRHTALARYSPLYRASRYYGADKILRRHLGVGEDYVLPLGLCHGVDFGHLSEPGDVRSPEPLYWAYNHDLLVEARDIKPAVAIPHPFLLAANQGSVDQKADILVVGPPPGRENDRRLLEALDRLGVQCADILVKRRVGWEGSGQFWQSNGFRPVSLNEPQLATYDDMVDLFGSYRHVIGCTVSSAIIFAAALGARITLLKDYLYSAYEVSGYDEMLPTDLTRARRFVGTLTDGTDEAKHSAARSILGSDLDHRPARIRAELEEAIRKLDDPVYVSPGDPMPIRWLLREAALLLGRPGIVSTPWRERLKRSRTGRIGIMKMNEVDYWLNGRTKDNFSLRPCAFVPGATEPGNAVDPY